MNIETEKIVTSMTNNTMNVSLAFELLLEEVDAEIDFVNRAGANSFENGSYDKTKEALERSHALIVFRDGIAAFRKDWENIATAISAKPNHDQKSNIERHRLGKLRKGVRTPETTFYKPILQILVRMGGKGKSADVVEIVGQVMKPVLKPVDYEPVSSDPNNPRWRNTAHWARNSMVEEGLLKADSSRGVWEIRDKGQMTLQQR